MTFFFNHFTGKHAYKIKLHTKAHAIETGSLYIICFLNMRII
jgi:hypothetical protein